MKLLLKPLTAATLLLLATSPALALYKVTGPDGKVTYTDRAPTERGARVTELRRDAVATPTDDNTLPLELRPIVARFPVTLYAAADCPPCDDARRLLQSRGVPFTEKRIVTDDDAAALERLVGSRTIPAATVGTQALRGFAATDWSAYLDAANYPRESRLPRNWQGPAATPLVARAAPPPAAPAQPAARAPQAASPPSDVPAPPGGIKF